MKLLALVLSISTVPLNLTSFFEPHSMIQKDLEASVLLHSKVIKNKGTKDEKRGFFGCSGTFIDKRLILTAAHCVDITAQVWARGPYESIGYPVHLIAFDRKKDLALYEVPFNHAFVKLGPMPKRGDKVLNIGSPLQFEFVPSEGIIGMTEMMIVGFTARYLVTTAMANPGSSGGGAFNTKGQLIGVNTMVVGLFGWQGITLTVNINSVRQFLNEVYIWYKPDYFMELE